MMDFYTAGSYAFLGAEAIVTKDVPGPCPGGREPCSSNRLDVQVWGTYW